MIDFINNTLLISLSHIFARGANHSLPAKVVGSKMFCNFGIPVKNEEGIKEQQAYHLYKENDSYILTTSKRKFNIEISSNKADYSTIEQRIILDFISKCLD